MQSYVMLCHWYGLCCTALTHSLTTSLVDDLETSTSGLKGVPLFDSHLIEKRRGEEKREEKRGGERVGEGVGELVSVGE